MLHTQENTTWLQGLLDLVVLPGERQLLASDSGGRVVLIDFPKASPVKPAAATP